MDTGCIGIFYVERELYETEQAGRDPTDLSAGSGECSLWQAVMRYFVGIYLARQKWFHIEIAFFPPDVAAGNCLAYGVNAKDGIVKRERTFAKKSYNWICLNTGDAGLVKRVKDFCEREYRKHIVYDTAGAHRVCLCPRKPAEGKAWCASFVVNALQQGEILKGYSAETLDVDDVVRMLLKHPWSIQTFTPFELQQVTKDGIVFAN